MPSDKRRVRRNRFRPSVWAALAVVVLLPAGCGGGSAPETKGQTVKVTERDFRISAPKRIAAGRVRLLVHNRGPDAHELVVAPKGRGPLPISRDGLRVEEDALKGAHELEAADPGDRSLGLDLQPGRYVLFCNMTGHFKGGMHTVVLVH